MTSTIIVSSGVTSDITVSAGVIMDVFNSGSTVSVLVTNGGTESVYNGGIANQTTINYGGLLSVGAGGISNAATVLNGAQEDVTSGGTSIGTYLDPDGREYVYKGGLASATNVLGKLELQGGNASGTIIGGSVYKSNEYIGLGGHDLGAVVLSGGEIDVGQGTTSGSILSGGNEVISGSNAFAYGTRIHSGSLFYFESGGHASGTIVESNGIYTIGDGRNDGTVGLLVNFGGTEILSADRPSTATSTTIEPNAFQYIYAGAVAIDTKFEGNGTVYSGGEILSSTLGGGTETIDPGGIASASTIVEGGYLVVSAGGIINNATISGGFVSEDTLNMSGGITFDGYGSELQILTTIIPKSFVVSNFQAGEPNVLGSQIQLPLLPYTPGATVVVKTPGVVTIIDGRQDYTLNIANAYVGETDFVFNSLRYLFKTPPAQMQFLRPHVAPTDAGLNLTPTLDMLTNPSTTTRPAAAPSMAASTSATIAPVPHLVTSAPHPLVVPPHGV